MSESDPEKEYVKGMLYQVKLADLKTDPSQPRKYFDETALKELTDSIENRGVLQPILFRQEKNKDLFLVSGERRLKAAKKLGHETIPGILIEDNPSEIALVENLLRQDLTAVELAEALDRTKEERGYTQEQLGLIIGKAESTVSEILSLMRLPVEIRDECRSDPSVSRQTLLNVSKKKTEKGMRSEYDKYKNKLKKDSEKKTRKRIDWRDKLTSRCDELKNIMAADNVGKLDDQAKTDLVASIEKLISEAQKLLEKINTGSAETAKLEEKPQETASKTRMRRILDVGERKKVIYKNTSHIK